MSTAIIKSLAKTSLPLTAALAALLTVGCGRRGPHPAYGYGYHHQTAYSYEQGGYTTAPVTYSDENGGYYVATVPENADTVVIILPGNEPARSQPVVAARPVLPPLPPPPPQVEAPRPVENPFADARSWTGKYVCTQGLTDLSFQVVSVAGPRIEAVFRFLHAASGASGSYRMSGHFDARSRTVSFDAGRWIDRPPNYVTIDMKGRISRDGGLFSGRITHPGCSWFKLHAER